MAKRSRVTYAVGKDKSTFIKPKLLRKKELIRIASQKLYNMLFATIVLLVIVIALILFTLHPIELKIEDCPAPKECPVQRPSCTCNCNFNLIQNQTVVNQTCPKEKSFWENWNPPEYPIYITNNSNWSRWYYVNASEPINWYNTSNWPSMDNCPSCWVAVGDKVYYSPQTGGYYMDIDKFNRPK